MNRPLINNGSVKEAGEFELSLICQARFWIHEPITIPLLRMQCTFCNNSNNNRHFPLSASLLGELLILM